MMRLQHVASHTRRRLLRHHAILRRISVATTLLTLAWVYFIYWGERVVYETFIDKCHWDEWENWPEGAAPHHVVLIADPQLVDPHTYPGRPWPLSTLTERYTDLYMARNFRLINHLIDPDTVIFLGDLFDGGREWAPEVPREMMEISKKRLEELGIRVPEEEAGHVTKRDHPSDSSVEINGHALSDGTESDKSEGNPSLGKRSLMSYKAALHRAHEGVISLADHNIGKDGRDLKKFIPGEDGRWSRWGHEQWEQDLWRFGRIFFDPKQLYPYQDRQFFPLYDVPTDPTSVENGATAATWKEYATLGGRQRRVISSLPGNHDLGFGSGVQLAIRDRFQSHFGDGNRLDVIGNHTFVSLDTPSLAAHSSFGGTGYETDEKREDHKHIWEPGMQFLDQLRGTAQNAISETLRDYYPLQTESIRWQHEVKDTGRTEGTATVETEMEQHEPKANFPVILLSHVPLFRPPETDCGPLREDSRAIQIQMGYQYQNVLTSALSKHIITKISDTAGRVIQVFSGDDHNYCEVSHRYNVASTFADNLLTEMAHIREITVKTFSWAMGVRFPGFVLVSLWHPVDQDGVGLRNQDEPTIQTHLCLLPNQLGIFVDYAIFLLLTVLVLAIDTLYWDSRLNPSLGSEDNPLSPLSETRMSLPRFQLGMNGSANGHPPKSGAPKTRQRGLSTTSSASHSRSNSTYLGVQRTYHARTRSITPPIGGPPMHQTNYYPSPSHGSSHSHSHSQSQGRRASYVSVDDDSDEEARLSAHYDSDTDGHDKWKWRQRTYARGPDKLRQALVNLALKVALVGAPAGLYYLLLIRRG